MPTEEEEQRRLLTRTREQLMTKKRRVMVQTRMRLHYFGLFPENIQRRIKLQDVEDILVGLEGELQITIGMLRDEWVELAKRIKEAAIQANKAVSVGKSRPVRPDYPPFPH